MDTATAKRLAYRALETARVRGASYADIRIILTRTESIRTENGVVAGLTDDETLGFGIRVIAGGSWGFASSNRITSGAIDEAAALAVKIAQAASTVNQRQIKLAAEPVYEKTWKTPIVKDPFQVGWDEKIKLLLDVDHILRKKPEIVLASGKLEFTREHQWMATSEGSFIEQVFYRSGGGVTAVAAGNGETQTRSYPSAHGGNYRSQGYEYIEALELVENAARVRDEAVALLSAEPCPSGEKDLILEGHQMALQIHESVGHPLELDRVLGMEANYAGRSFVTTEKMGKFRYGSEHVNLVVDTTLPGGLATCGYDDDGVAAQKFSVVENGIFKTYFTNRELSGRIGEERSRGCNRTWGYGHIPIVRIPNLSLMPGKWKYDDLIADTEDGILMATNKSWSIDQMRLNFQFGCEIAWEIKHGKKGKMYKSPNYQGQTPEFWQACDAVCDQDSWELWGVDNCGKGEPMQVAEMTHANSPARFKKIQVGIR